jgi:GNAT superfamily N-acetyltransferase
MKDDGRATAGAGMKQAVVAAVRAAVGRYVYRTRTFVVVRTELAGPPVPDRLGDIVFRPATPADLDNLHDLQRSTRRYVEEHGDVLFVACHGDRIVATRRYAHAVPTAARDGHGLIPRILRLEPGQIWTADAFLLPEYRNRGINARFGLYTMRLLASRGYREQIGTMDADNIAALRSSRHRGARVMYYVAYTRVFFHERLRVSTQLPASLAAKLE